MAESAGSDVRAVEQVNIYVHNSEQQTRSSENHK
jgi:hypothetical protein